MSDLAVAIHGLTDDQADYAKAASYYEGDVEEVFASEKLRRALSRSGTSAYRLNFSRVPVTTVLDRLEIQAISSTDARAQARLDEIQRLNGMDEEHNDVHRWALVHGEAYLIVWPDEDGNPQMSLNKADTTRIFYDPEHPRRKKFAAKMWAEGKRIRLNLYYSDRIEKYITAKDGDKADEKGFIPFFDDETEEWPENPWGEVPVFHFRTGRPHGRPEHKDAWSPQDMINKLVITQMAANDYQGFPQRYALQGNRPSNEASDFEDDSDAEDTSNLTSGPGEMWWLDADDVGQFDVADPAAFLDPLKEYVKAIASMTHTPLHYFEGMGDVPSGESLRAILEPLLKKVEDRMLVFGNAWREAYAFALRILGIEDVEVEVVWADIRSADDSDAWSVAKMKLDAGVPFRQVMVEMGYSTDQVDGFLKDGAKDADTLLDLAERIGTAVQRLGLGVQYGVITTDQASALLPLPRVAETEPAPSPNGVPVPIGAGE